jgi:glycerol-3-phosphate acyltransferase PlsX
VRIALDAMGGDYAPGATVTGALLSLRELDQSHLIQLVGNEAVVRPELDALLHGEFADMRAAAAQIEIVHAPDTIDMSEKPSTAVRGKPNSSMVTGLRMQKEGKSDAFVSAGNTGAQMAASVMLLRLHANLARPAIVTQFPTAARPIAVLDSGANVDCSAVELLQFAHLGTVYARAILGRENPRIALLSIGEESEKGNAVVKEAYPMLQASGLNFVGNVEGRDLPHGAVDSGPFDVVVCDGFVGNIVLKLYEAMTPMLLGRIVESTGIDAAELRVALRDFDYSEYGGAPLLGVRGVSIIAHGKSSARAIKNALVVAANSVRARISDEIGQSLSGAGQ